MTDATRDLHGQGGSGMRGSVPRRRVGHSMSDRVDVVIVGAGQAGLAVSRELTQAAVAHVLLEKGKVGQTWRGRWDSFCLVTPNWFLQLPGHPYDGGDPDGFILAMRSWRTSSATRQGSRPRCGKVSR